MCRNQIKDKNKKNCFCLPILWINWRDLLKINYLFLQWRLKNSTFLTSCSGLFDYLIASLITANDFISLRLVINGVFSFSTGLRRSENNFLNILACHPNLIYQVLAILNILISWYLDWILTLAMRINVIVAGYSRCCSKLV